MPDPNSPTAFDRALEEYLANIPKDKTKAKFIELCRSTGEVTADKFNDLIQEELSNRSVSGPASRLFNRLAGAIMDYSGVIEQFASVQPLPLAIIWGGLKIIIQIAGRRKETFDLMSKELRALMDQIFIINDHEDLYGDSEEMQNLIFRSYVNIIRFWHRVYKECSTTNLASFGRSTTSGKINKLKSIVNDLKSDADIISEKGKTLEAKLNADERKEAEKEREKADEERTQQNIWRRKQNAHNYVDLRTKMREYLSPSMFSMNEATHQKNLQQYLEDTCRWITDYPDFQSWSKPSIRSAPEKRILCVNGPAGFGKSILSSFAIRHLQKTHNAAVGYFFCQLSTPCDNACDILRLLAQQLFDDYCARRLPIDDDLCNEVLGCKSQEQFQDLIGKLCVGLRPHPIYFIIDGLDEAQKPSSQQALSTVIGFICSDMLHNSKLWVTQRRLVRPINCYDLVISPHPHYKLEIRDHTEGDVGKYIDAKFGELERRFGDMGEKERYFFQFALTHLKLLAGGHFLWARLMTEDFEDIADIQDLFKRISGRPPTQLDELYKTFFTRIRSENRKIASKVISLIAFARRQLRIEEVRDATILFSRGKKGDRNELANMSTTTFFSKFTVLVELEKGDETSEGSCRLVHSSVLEFLQNQPSILGEDRNCHITPFSIADACLMYLTRSIYANPLEEQQRDDIVEWVDSSGHSMREHHFAHYAAKYWSRHLDNSDFERSMRERAIKFLESRNFQTCLQIQSIWVQGNFDTYSFGDQKTVLRALPDWLMHTSSSRAKHRKPSKYWLDYCILLHNWRRLLSCGGCHDIKPGCPLLMYRGHIDRVWWTSLGVNHMFSNFRGRYVSFTLAEESEKIDFERSERFEALCITSDFFVVLRLSSWDRQLGLLEFTCVRWKRGNLAPIAHKKQIIRTDEYVTNWRVYGRRSSDENVQLVARSTMFSASGEYLCIGSQLFFLDNQHDYSPLEFAANKDELPRYFEDVVSRGPFLAIGSRAFTFANEVLSPHNALLIVETGSGFLLLERLARRRRRDSSSDSSSFGEQESDAISDDFSAESSSVIDEAQGYESWSDGSSSSDAEKDAFDLDSSVPSTSSEPATDSGISESENDADSKEGAESDTSSSTHKSSNDSDSKSTQSSVADAEADTSDDEYNEGRKARFVPSTIEIHHEESTLRFKPVLKKSKEATSAESRMVFTVFDTSGSFPKKLFQFTYPFKFSRLLFESPPAIHPVKTLVVWPLGGDAIVLADFVVKTYYMYKIGSNIPSGRSVITVKVHFHSSGRFLHIASLETLADSQKPARQSRQSRDAANAESPPPFRLFALVSTHRLSSRNTTRRQPTLVHRVKVDLGKYIAFQTKSLPTFTWTDNDIYLTQRARELTVSRIPLFKTSSSDQPVLVPINKIFLPDTAESSAVHFVPPIKESPAHVILGSESGYPGWTGLNADTDQVARFASAAQDATTTNKSLARKMIARPVGCLLGDEDIGGWVATGNNIPTPSSPRPSNERREKFNAADDFDHVEPYLRFGSRSPAPGSGSQDPEGRVRVKIE